MLKLVHRFEAGRPFTEAEAWMLFRLAAVAEAIGWTLLITGIAMKRYLLHGNNVPVLIAGQIHGMLFFVYLMAASGLYPSLGWSRWRGLFALAFSVPPYGTLVFEQWAARKRRAKGFKTYRHYLAYTALTATTS